MDGGIDETHHKVVGNADVLRRASRGKLLTVDSITIKVYPVGVLLAVGEEAALHILFDLGDPLWGSKFRLFPGDLAFDEEFYLFGLPMLSSTWRRFSSNSRKFGSVS